MNYHVKVTRNRDGYMQADLRTPYVSDGMLRYQIEARALAMQKERDLPLPAIVLIEQQD